jgi:serine phosphatase RsbU (regulator of sigma subunit)/pSer/pThr/pTyr-binding forkhead associated (FHA) protein
MAVLKHLTGEQAGTVVDLKADVTVVGRLPECDIVLTANGVSRRHAEIRKVGPAFHVVDLDSRNKTLVNNTELKGGVAHLLQNNDRINICNIELLYAADPAPESSDTAPRTIDSAPGADVIEVTETDGAEQAEFRTLEASRSSTMASAVRPEVKLKAILDITKSLSKELRIDAVAPKIVDSLMEIFPGAERLFLLLQDPTTKRLVRKAFKHRPQKRTSFFSSVPADEVPTSISRSIVDFVLGQKKGVLSQDAGSDKNLPTSASIADLKIRSVMCVPLLTPDNKAIGILQLDTSDRRQFNEDDLDVLAAVASQAAISIQNASMLESLLARERLNRDLKIAEQVQKKFIPQSVPSVPGYEFFAHYQPTYEVGGDYYDFVSLPDGRVATAVGDVSGKGVAAALMMAKFSGDTRYCILTENAPAPTATRLNGLLCAAGIEDKFITLGLCVLDAQTGKLTLTSAGHTPVIIRHADGKAEEVGQDVAGVPLGIMEESVYQQTEVQLNEGDVVVLYSDGVTDARSPGDELYDSQSNHRLIKRVAQAGGGPEAVGRAILQDIREFSAGHSQADDITLVCLGPTPG